jgi:4-hydroxy-4-methyl-2-oxoglutarate aldolase
MRHGLREVGLIMETTDTKAVLAALRSVDSCAVSDALDRLDLPAGVGDLAVRTTEQAVVGRAVTVELGDAGTGAAGRHLATAAIEASGPDDVLVIAHRGRVDCSGWGGLLSLAASLRHVEGVVVDGACRDVGEARDLNFAIFARAATPATARSRVVEISWGGPVEFSHATVGPGDFVIADVNGVAFVPAARAGEVADLALQIAGRESRMAEVLRTGEPVSRVLGATYEELTTQRTSNGRT